MPLPLSTPLSPVAGSTNQASNQPVVVRVTATLPELVREETIEMTIDGQPAVTSELFVADGQLVVGASTLQTSLYSFSSVDIGKAVFIESANARNSGKAYIAQVISTSKVRVERTALSGFTASVTNGLNTVTTSAPYGANIQVGDYVSFDAGATLYLVGATTGPSAFSLSTNYAGTTNLTAAVTPGFHTSDATSTWTLHGFGTGFLGTIEPAGGGGNGFDVTVYPVKQLSGTVQSDGAGALSGTSSKFLSELNATARIALTGHRTNQALANVVSIAGNSAATTAAYAASSGFVTGYRSADLNGQPTVQTPVVVTIEARDTAGQQATLDPLSVSQPVIQYQFNTTTRPAVASANAPVANPFGYGVRVAFTEALMAYNATTNPAIASTDTWTVTALSPAPSQPMPPNPTVTAVTYPGGNPGYVDLTFAAPMQNGALYRVEAKNLALRASSGVLVDDSPSNRIDYAGYGPAELVEAYKDTVVNAPIINGPPLVEYGGPPIQIELQNLDPDVVALQLGASSQNVTIVPATFVNNHDGPIVDGIQQEGTGTIMVQPSALMTSYAISFEAIDDVDNVSAESNVLRLAADPATVPGTSLSILPKTFVHKETCDRLLADIPQGSFYVKSGYVVPYTYDAYPFTLRVIERGQPVSIVVTREGATGPQNVPVIQTFIPQNLTETVFLQLGQGRNVIIATDGIRTDFIIVTATIYATILCTVASEIYSYSQVELEEIQRSINSEVSTRLADAYVPFSDILPFVTVRSQQTLSTKMAIRAHTGDYGSERAVRDLNAAIFQQTPHVVETRNSRTTFRPDIERLYNAQEDFGGFDFHTWTHNSCLNAWKSYLEYIAARKSPLYLPLEASEEEIVIRDQYGVTRRLRFNTDGPFCSTLSATTTCFEDIAIDVFMNGDFAIPICAATYPFDSCFTYENPLGNERVTFDSSIPWDTLPLDDDALDPGNDGWIGLCWAGRWDSGRTIQTLTADGGTTAGSRNFSSIAYTFTDADLGRWVWLRSGSRQRKFQIKGIVSSSVVRLNETFDITEATLDWELQIEVHPLDSTGVMPTWPVEQFSADGSFATGLSSFTSATYVFSSVDVGRNIVIQTADGPVSLLVMAVLASNTIQVGQTNGASIAPYIFTTTESGLSWEMWDAVPPSCLYDGYANLAVLLASADVTISNQPTLTVHAALDSGTDLYAMATMIGGAIQTSSA